MSGPSACSDGIKGEHVGEIDGPVVVDAVRIVGIGESED